MKRQILTISLAMVLAVSCGSSSDESSSSSSSSSVSNPITDGVSGVVDASLKMSGVIGSSSGLTSSSNRRLQAKATQGFTEWDISTNGFIDQVNDVQTSPREWMGIELDVDAQRSNGSAISIFGRLKSALDIVCAVGAALGNSSSYPSNGTQSITLSGSTKQTIESTCDMEISGQMDGATISVEIADAEDTTIYDKKLTFTDFGQTFYFRSDSNEINIANSEVNENGVHRTVVDYDLSTNVLKFEYISGPQASVTGSSGEYVDTFRLYLDQTNDEGYLMSMKLNDQSGGEVTQYIVSARPVSVENNTANETVAISLRSDNFDSSSSPDAREACIDASNGDIGSDNSLSCSITGKTLDGVTTGGDLISDSNAYDYTKYNSVDSATTLSFDASTFVTDAYSEN